MQAMKQLQGVIAFVEAANAGSLAAAARRLDLTPAAISKSVGKLEQQLGVRLFQRSTRSLRLTAEGEAFLARSRLALRTLDEAVAEVGQSAATPQGRVRISVGMAFGRRFVLPALPALSERHPGLALEVDLDNRPVDLVAEGYDLGIRGGRIEDSSLIARHVCGLPTALFASPGYLRRHGVPRTADELAGHRCVTVRFASGPQVWRFRAAKGAEAREFTPAASLIVNDAEALAELALADAGIVQTALRHALPYLRTGRLKLLLIDRHEPGKGEVVLHYPHRLYLAPRVRVVVDGLLEHLREQPDLQLTPQAVLAAHPGWAAAPVGGARRRG